MNMINLKIQVLIITLLLLFIPLTFINAQTITPVPHQYPPVLSASRSWPTSIKAPQWDFMARNYTDSPNSEWSIYKPKILNDINDMLNVLGANTPVKRHAISLQIMLPIFFMPTTYQNIPLPESEQWRIIWSIKRMFEVSKETDTPIGIKLLGYQWWGVDPQYYNPGQFDQIWLDTHPDWSDHVEWWGWSKDYVWADPKTNPSRPHVLWRNWGQLFEVATPHANFESPKYRELIASRIRPAALEIASQYTQLVKENRQYLLSAFIPESEVLMGGSFSPIKTFASEFGVRSYITKYCPDDVLKCLPAKPDSKTREQWIKEKSDEFYRPDGFEWNQIRVLNEYLSFIAKIGFDAGIPKDKIYSHAGSHLNYHKGSQSFLISYVDAAINPYSIPAYSYYGWDIGSDYTKNELKWLKETRKIQNFGVIEYMDYGTLWNDWVKRFNVFLSSDNPQLTYINFQNWDSLRCKDANCTVMQDDPNIIPGREMLKYMVTHWQSPLDINNDGYHNNNDLTVIFTNYNLSTTQGKVKGDLNGDSKVNLFDVMVLMAMYGK